MSHSISRRQAIKQLAAAGAGIAATPIILRGQTQDIVVAGKPVEIAVSAVGPAIARITIRPITDSGVTPVATDGALAQAEWGKPLATYRGAASGSQSRTVT